MADTASLVVRVKSTGIDATSKKLGNLDRTSSKTEKSTVSLASAMGRVAGPVSIAATAIAAATGAVAAFAVASAKSDRELTNLSRTAKTTREDFAALSFVFKQYGVDAKGTADAMNDVSERLGEFAAAGTGPFQDFADVMGLTKAEAVSMADELQRLKPEEAIQRMVKQMEDAGVQGAQMSFVLKSMSNDLEYASAAFANNGAEINKLKKSYEDVNSQLMITASQSADLAELSSTFSLLTESSSMAATSIYATLAPTLTNFFNDVISIVPQAEQAIVDFINRFLEVESINSIEAVNKEFERQNQIMQENQWAQDALASKTILTGKAQDRQIKALEAYNEAQARAEELIFKRIDLEDELQKKLLEDANKPKTASGGIGKEAQTVASKDTDAQAKQAAAFLEQLRQANLDEMQLIDTQEAEKQARLLTYREQALINEQQYQQALFDIQTSAVMARAELQNRALDEESKAREAAFKAELAARSAAEKLKTKQIDDGIDAQRNMTNNLRASLGEQNDLYKASAIATATMDTYKAATGAYAALASIPYVGPILGAAAAGAAIVAGLANVNAIRNAREQGGIMTSGSPYQMAERGKAEVIVPAGASRARTAQQMRDIMGQNGGDNQIKGVTIVNNTTGRVDSATTEIDQEGMLRVLIDEHVSNSLLTQDSQISKARRASAGQPGF